MKVCETVLKLMKQLAPDKYLVFQETKGLSKSVIKFQRKIDSIGIVFKELYTNLLLLLSEFKRIS